MEKVSRSKTVWLGVFGVFLLVKVVSASAGLLEEMAAFDREYIPALALTNQPDRPEAQVKEAFRRLEKGWDRFLKSLAPEQKNNPILQSALKEAEKNIREAGELMAAGRRAEAHEALEGIRNGFWKARSAMGLEYLPDRLTAFHNPMEDFFNKVAASRSQEDRDVLKPDLDRLSVLWAKVEQAGLDPSLFGFTAERTKLFEDLVKKEREILSQLKRLLDTPDQEGLVQTAASMKSNFARIYTLFGDFKGL